MAKSLVSRFLLALYVLLPFGPALADDVECSGSQVKKCFVDGPSTTCLCLDAPAEVEQNPAPEPDGQVNEDAE